MSYYRLYFLDREGHIQRALELECDSDDDAVSAASLQASDRALELWNRDRLVWRRPAASHDG